MDKKWSEFKIMELNDNLLIFLKEKHQFIINVDDKENYYLYDDIFEKNKFAIYEKHKNDKIDNFRYSFLKDDFYNWERIKKLQKIKDKIK